MFIAVVREKCGWFDDIGAHQWLLARRENDAVRIS